MRESGKYSEEEKKNTGFSEEQLLAEEKKLLRQEKKRAEIREHIKADEALTKLHDLLESHDVELDIADVEHIQKALDGEDLHHDDIEDILEKIDAIEKSGDMDRLLPPDLQITKQEYHNALVDEDYREQAIMKLDSALTILADNISGGAANIGFNIFSGYMAMLDKQLIMTQGHHIDMKDHLDSLQKPRAKPETNKSFTEKLRDFLR